MSMITKNDGTFVETEVDGEVVIMNMDTGQFYAMDESALLIWRAIDDGLDRETLIARLAADYDESAKVIADDVDAFLDALIAAGLIRQPLTT